MREFFNKKLFGKTLRLYRNIKGHTLDAVSIQTGISIATLHRYEIGLGTPLIENIMILCHDYLKMPIDTFTSTNISCAADILSDREIHAFASIAQHLTLEELLIVSQVLRQYEKISTLFDDIQNNTFCTKLKREKTINE